MLPSVEFLAIDPGFPDDIRLSVFGSVSGGGTGGGRGTLSIEVSSGFPSTVPSDGLRPHPATFPCPSIRVEGAGNPFKLPISGGTIQSEVNLQAGAGATFSMADWVLPDPIVMVAGGIYVSQDKFDGFGTSFSLTVRMGFKPL